MSEQDDDFAAMLEASLKPRRIERGQTIEGRIVGIGADVAFIDVGGKGEATIDLAELKDEDGDLEAVVCRDEHLQARKGLLAHIAEQDAV